MKKKIHFLLVHGWGFNSDFWKKFCGYLLDFSVTAVDLGFFNESAMEKYSLSKIKEQHNDSTYWIGVGHSLGMFYLLQNYGDQLDHYIAVNSFTKFTKSDNFPEGISCRIIDRMKHKLCQQPEDVVANFYKQCGLSFPIPLSSLNIERLNEGLNWLKNNDYRNLIPSIKHKLTCIASTVDPVVSSGMTDASFKACAVNWVEDNSHVLPLTKPEQCFQIFKKHIPI